MITKSSLSTAIWFVVLFSWLSVTSGKIAREATSLEPNDEDYDQSAKLTQLMSNKLSKQAYIDPRTTLACHRREYTFKASQTDNYGNQCWQYVKALSCWGRCDTGEIADWRFPFKKSYHPVCLLDKRRLRTIRLKNCSEKASLELRYYTYTEALSCSCQICHSSTTNCEGTPYGGAARAP
ncbi:Glycoprotein hormone beta-5 [Halotydeus destructor]|nr:Glycoprotein hormone beta-5 [Halotydeus destructor]